MDKSNGADVQTTSPARLALAGWRPCTEYLAPLRLALAWSSLRQVPWSIQLSRDCPLSRARDLHWRRTAGLDRLRPFIRHWDITRLPYDGAADRWFDPA